MADTYEITISTAALVNMARAQGALSPSSSNNGPQVHDPQSSLREGLTLRLSFNADGVPNLRACPPSSTITPPTNDVPAPPPPLSPPPQLPQTEGQRTNNAMFPPPAQGRHHSKMINIHYPEDAPTPLKVATSRAYFDDLPVDELLTKNHRLFKPRKSILKKTKLDDKEVPHAGLWANLVKAAGVARKPYTYDDSPYFLGIKPHLKRSRDEMNNSAGSELIDTTFPGRMFRRILIKTPKRARSASYSSAASRVDNNAPRFSIIPPTIRTKRPREPEEEDASDTDSHPSHPPSEQHSDTESPLHWQPEDLVGWRPAPPRPEFSGSQVIWGTICANTVGKIDLNRKPTLRFAPKSLEVAHYIESRPRTERECKELARQFNPALQAAYLAQKQRDMVKVRGNWRLGRRIAKFRHERVAFMNKVIDAAETTLQIEAAELALDGLEAKCLRGDLYLEASSLAQEATLSSFEFFQRSLDGRTLAIASVRKPVTPSPQVDVSSPGGSTTSTLEEHSPSSVTTASPYPKAAAANPGGSPTAPRGTPKRSTTIADLGPSSRAIDALPVVIPQPPQKRPTVEQWSATIPSLSPTVLSSQLEKYLDGLCPAERVAYFKSLEDESRVSSRSLASGSNSQVVGRAVRASTSSSTHNNNRARRLSTASPLPSPLPSTSQHQPTIYKSSVIKGRQYRSQEHDGEFLANLPRDEGAHQGIDDPSWSWENDSDGGTSVAFDLDLQERDQMMKEVNARSGWW